MNIRPDTVAIGAASGGTQMSGGVLAALPGDLNAIVSPSLPASQRHRQAQETASAGRNLPAWTSTQDVDHAMHAGIARLAAQVDFTEARWPAG